MECALISQNIQLMIDFEASPPQEPSIIVASYYNFKGNAYAISGNRTKASDCFEKAWNIASQLQTEWCSFSVNLRLSCIDFQNAQDTEKIRPELMGILEYLKGNDDPRKSMNIGRVHHMLMLLELKDNRLENCMKHAEKVVQAVKMSKTGVRGIHFNFLTTFVKILEQLAYLQAYVPRIRNMLFDLDTNNSKWRYSEISGLVWNLNLSTLYRRLGYDS